MVKKIACASILGVIFFVLFYVLISFIRQPQNILLAKQQQQLQESAIYLQYLPMYHKITIGFWLSFIIIGSIGGLSFVFVICRNLLKRCDIHEYIIGESSFRVHTKDLGIAAPVAMGLVQASQLQFQQLGEERLFDIYSRLFEIPLQAIQLASPSNQAIRGIREVREIREPENQAYPEGYEKRAFATSCHVLRGFLWDILAKQKEFPEKERITQKAIAEASKCPESTLSEFLNGQKLVSENTFNNLHRWLRTQQTALNTEAPTAPTARTLLAQNSQQSNSDSAIAVVSVPGTHGRVRGR